MINQKKIVVTILLLSLLFGCGSRTRDNKNIHLYTVKQESLSKVTYFTGVIKPLYETMLISPMDAVVETVKNHYGQYVNKNQVVVILDSSELQKQYNELLAEYLKAKNNLAIENAKFTGTQDLWDAGLLAKNNYLSEKSSLDTARVSMLQVTKKLTEILEKIDNGEGKDFSKLRLAETDKVRQALAINHNRIALRAHSKGILLYPPKVNDEKTAPLARGVSIKAGEVVALVGDMTGVKVDIDIPEIDINKVHVGMLADVTGIALGNQVLKGQVVAVNEQASNSGLGSLPSFTAVVAVKKLSETQQTIVKVGMSAVIALLSKSQSGLVIPMAALGQENGRAFVRVLDGKSKKRFVSTGEVHGDKVVVVYGLREGEVVEYGQ